jgi:hypothetical protein
MFPTYYMQPTNYRSFPPTTYLMLPTASPSTACRFSVFKAFTDRTDPSGRHPRVALKVDVVALLEYVPKRRRRQPRRSTLASEFFQYPDETELALPGTPKPLGTKDMK